jgi:LEA14-like dessication related protein
MLQKEDQRMSATRRSTRFMALAVLVGGVVGCGSLSRPTGEIVGVRIQDVDLKSLTLVFDVQVGNPYPVALPMVGVDYRLASEGQLFLSGKAEQAEGSVPAHGQRTIGLPVTIVYLDLMAAVKSIRPGAVVPYAAELDLTVDAPVVGRTRLPLRKEGRLPVPTVPDVEVAEVKWEKVSTAEIRGTARLNVVNRNRFAVELNTLQYALALGDVEVAKASLAQPVALAADGGKGSIEIPIALSPQQAGLGLLRMLTGSGSSYSFRGTADLRTAFGAMSLPVEKVGKTLFNR